MRIFWLSNEGCITLLEVEAYRSLCIKSKLSVSLTDLQSSLAKDSGTGSKSTKKHRSQFSVQSFVPAFYGMKYCMQFAR